MTTNFTKEQLFAYLKKDRLAVGRAKINEAMNGNADSMYTVAQAYRQEKQHYEKAMAWYQLAAGLNNSKAQNSIGHMYDKGLGVTQDYLTALEWFIKSALQNNIHAWINIRHYYQNGYGVPINKEKEHQCNLVIILKSNTEIHPRYHLIDKLISETNDLLQAARKIKDDKSRVNNDSLLILKTEDRDEVQTKAKNVEDINQTNQNLVEKTPKEMDVLLATKTKEQEKLNQEINCLKLLQDQMDQVAIASVECLKAEVQTNQFATEDKVKESESTDQFEHEIKNINDEIQSLKLVNSAQLSQLDVKDSQVKKFENVIKSLDMVPDTSKENVAKQIEELKKSYKTIEMLLEQEKIQKADQIMLLKQEIQDLRDEKKQKNDDWEMC